MRANKLKKKNPDNCFRQKTSASMCPGNKKKILKIQM